MKIRIKNDDGVPGVGTLTLEDGAELEHVTAADICIRPQEVISARLEFCLPVLDVLAEATVSEEHLRELAAVHGFDLVKKAPGAI